MTGLFLGLLALAWIAVVLPATVRARRTAPLTTAERFKRGLELIAPSTPAPRRSSGRWIVVPGSADRLARESFRRAQRRRKRILVALVAAAGLSGVGAAFGGSGLLEVHIGCDAALAGYVALLLETKRRRKERESKVRSLEARRRRRQMPFLEPASVGRARGQ